MKQNVFFSEHSIVYDDATNVLVNNFDERLVVQTFHQRQSYQ